MEYLSNTTLYVIDTRAFLQQLVAAAGNKDAEDLSTVKLEKNAAIADKARCEDRVRSIEMQFKKTLSFATQ